MSIREAERLGLRVNDSGGSCYPIWRTLEFSVMPLLGSLGLIFCVCGGRLWVVQSSKAGNSVLSLSIAHLKRVSL
jgi:hypothetical protein